MELPGKCRVLDATGVRPERDFLRWNRPALVACRVPDCPQARAVATKVQSRELQWVTARVGAAPEYFRRYDHDLDCDVGIKRHFEGD